jgi:phage-related protein
VRGKNPTPEAVEVVEAFLNQKIKQSKIPVLRQFAKDWKRIGEELKTVEFGWPLGMPIVRKIVPKLWEVRIRIKNGIARVIFTVVDDYMILLHGFIKKSQKTPKDDLELALKRLRLIQEGER